MVRTFPGSVCAVGATAILTILCASAGGARAVCVGDCNADGQVLINEVVSGVNIFIGTAAVTTCQNADQNGDGQVLINEVVSAVNSFLDPTTCPMVAGGPPTPTVPPAVTNTPTPSPTPLPPTATATTALGPPLGDRVFSLGAGSGFFSSLAASVKAGVPVGSLTLSAGPKDASGRSTVTLGNPGTVIRTDIALGGLTLCTKIDSCTGTLYCNGGAFVDVLNSLDSLKAGLTCVRDGTHGCPPPPTPAVCCSNSCEGVGVGSGNSSVQVSPPPSVTPTDRGSGAMLLMCTQRSATVTPIGDCSKADFTSAKPADQWYTTGIDTAQVLEHCPGSGAPVNKVPKLARQGTSFSCDDWTTENGKGVLGFTIPSEEGSAAITGDGANGGLWSDQ